MRIQDPDRAARRRAAAELTSGYRGLISFLFFISGIINILALTGAFYMLQIYDRALGSGSIPTLLAISILAIGLYLAQGLFDIIRSQILVRIGGRIDAKFAPLAHRVVIDMPRHGYSTTEALERGRDVDTLRGFLGSQAPVALFDLFWVPIFVGFVYLLHPLLGAVTLGGAVVLTLLTVVTELVSRGLNDQAQKALVQRNMIADSNARNAEVLRAMGMGPRAISRFETANDDHLILQTRATDVTGTFAAVARVLRMMLQSAVLGLGAWLVIRGQLTPGAIIAASITSARALAPIDLAIANWRGVVLARAAAKRLRDTMVALASVQDPMALPAPRRMLQVEGLTVAAPGNGRVLLSDVSFTLSAGQALGVIGPSGGGKSTLARALTGIWAPVRGEVRLDGAALSQWTEEAIGRHIGYLPQDVVLMEGDIRANIARLEEDPDPEAVVTAATAAGVHEMITRLADGYQTRLGSMGGAISGGQRQRIGLARALFGAPFVVVLDEPNSNLDGEGEAELSAAIAAVRARGGITIVITHRPSALAAVDLVAVIQNGKMTAFGDKSEIIARPVRAETGSDPARDLQQRVL
ncbi:type I secretion system permease/ATPase [Falsigemmobacter faecalis]|uniref:Type I secretion system permease/ATPase n=1 Tax=Falsigemmobacter faecalis TaxID=2488730 RepID=A0A3P3D9J3_9RHOB|nr:type I secretion system permease/ATPase [Falsigemmobacter faecalis]RRH69048.1 type I secretion system permease/ATPase [Falsigemmobacter faecalis]